VSFIRRTHESFSTVITRYYLIAKMYLR